MARPDANLPATTRDSFLGGRVTLCQPQGGFRAGLDSILLAASLDARPGDTLLELGMGVGVASLCAASRLPGVQIIGVEIDPEMAALARTNIEANGFADRVRVVEGDVANLPPEIREARFDHVFLNPPFQAHGRGTPPPDPTKARAHMEGGHGGQEKPATLEDWIGGAVKRLKPKGRLTLIHRADRLDQALSRLWGAVGEITLFPLWPKAGEAARRVLVTGRRAVKGPLTLAPGLVLHGADGRPSETLEAIARHGAALAINSRALSAPSP